MPSYKLEDVSLPLLLLFLPVFVLDFIFSVLSAAFGGAPRGTRAAHKKQEKQSVPVGTATATHSPPFRSPNATGHFIDTYRGCTTLYEMVQSGVARFPSNVAQKHYVFTGLKKAHPTDRFPTKQFDYGRPPVEVTYKEFGANLDYFGKGLRELGMEPQPPSSSTAFDTAVGRFSLVIFEDTCKEWTTALQGALSQAMVVATCYATLGHEAVISAVAETGATALFVNWKHVQVFYEQAHRMPTLKTIIASTNELADGDTVWMPPEGSSSGKSSGGIRVVTYDAALEMGKSSKIEPHPPKASDVAVVMYTSGSTGKPKGVVMLHSNLVAGLSGMVTNVHLREGQEVFPSYLPLAHILALQVENILLTVGSTLCYTDARQLPTTMPKFKPTVFAGVPKVWEILQGAVEKQIDKGPHALKVVFNTLLAWKMFMLSKLGMDTPVSNLFFGMGYALTETCVGGCFQSTADQRPGIVGPPVPCVEAMIQSEPDFKDSAGLPYLHTDTRGANGEPVLGRGEICFRGPSISLGYYKLPQKTKEDFDSEGYFHTGDIGQMTADGVIQIVDRKKNLVKLKGGEYVAIEAMETAFAASPYVAALCVIANGDLDGPIPVVCTDNHVLEKWAKQANVQYSTDHELAEMDATRKEVVRSLIAKGKEAGLSSLELRIKDCVLVADAVWMPGHGMTASMKLDRRQIMDMHDKEIKETYKRLGLKV